MPTMRKRPAQEMSAGDGQPPKEPSMLDRIRNMWQFANLFQFIMLFGQALKLDDNLDMEDLEAECLKPGSMALQNIGLGLLKFLSSHRGLTHELFEEYTRRQFLSKAPEKNPFGSEETPAKFADFDVFTKIRVLQQMTQLIMVNPERLREKTEEQKDLDQTNWRIEPYGWDRHDRTYFVLDDNRLYRLTEAPPLPPKAKKNTKKAKAAQRAHKRRRVSSAAASDVDDAGDEASEAGLPAEPEDDGLGGMRWECLAVTLQEIRDFLSTVQKTKDPNEKTLRDQIQDHLLPILEKQEESRKRKQLQREKELLSLEKMAHAKRSSRIAGKLEQQKMEEHAREADRRRREEEVAQRREEQQRLKMERDRDNRLMSREKRLRERETRRRLHEEELAQLSEDSKGASSASARMSERRRLAEIDRAKKALQELEEEDDDWMFDCVCGVYGQIDDGTHSVACEKCNTWQHSKCLGIDETEADKDDFHFICSSCRRRAEADASNDAAPRLLKIKVDRHQQTDSAPGEQVPNESAATAQLSRAQLVVELDSRPSMGVSHDPDASQAVPEPGSQVAPAAQSPQRATPNPPHQTPGIAPPSQLPVQASPGQAVNPFSLPHPTLARPDLVSAKSGAQDSTANPASISTVDDDGPSRLTARSAALNGSLSPLAGSGSGAPSPSKQPHDPPTTKTPSAPAASNGLAPSLSAEKIAEILPHVSPAQSRDARSDPAPKSSPLPPPSAGLSPTKHSPPVPRTQPRVNGGSSNGLATPLIAGVQQPAAVLPAVAREQILTPPVKHAELAKAPPSQQQSPGLQTPKLVPSSSPRLEARSPN